MRLSYQKQGKKGVWHHKLIRCFSYRWYGETILETNPSVKGLKHYRSTFSGEWTLLINSLLSQVSVSE